jgi:hypothetical protein
MKHAKKSTKLPLLTFNVIINLRSYTTSASSSAAAVSKAAYRYAQEMDMAVGLVQWKIKHEELKAEVKEEVSNNQ